MLLKTFSFMSIAIITLFLLWGLGWLWFATTVALANPEKSEIKTEAIVVLTGGNGRVNAGLDLLAKNIAPKLFISGVNKDVTKEDIYKSWKNPTSNKPCCIFLGYEAEDTVGNAVETRDWIIKNNIQKFTLVTSSYHMPRAYQEITEILPEQTIIEYPVLTDDFAAWQGRFWTLTLSEYNKMLIRWLHIHDKETSAS